MAQRQQLHELLVALLGSNNVYFQPPEDTKLTYPCLIYYLNDHKFVYANNKPYKGTKRYQLTFIGRDPDSDVHDKIVALPLCRFERSFTTSFLTHYVYNIFF